ncbi:DUF4157 domain-containing protein [Fulvivirga maritima]|uniref:eCIS core domain-containing protein n=1 Tax=Fulvivirga maritima TaxID=2904247 RepID=UPI001F1734BB|nr:DUF4157 domain-containing protein [Fulvivirga maritima]UII25811.1 DUF4157 domain-containing protein [Fulvivirga maritima]
MNTYDNKTQKNKSQSAANAVGQKKSVSESTFQFVDNRPQTVTQRKLQEMANNSPQAKQAVQLQAMADNYSAQQQQPIQKIENNTGLPDNLKSGIENLSGYSMDDVRVHYNSDKPAQLQAHAYAQGTDIHLAPGQEKHLPHEAWHVVQQMQGRVRPTMQMKVKLNVNDDAGLEKEADVMGAKAYAENQTGFVQRKLNRTVKQSTTVLGQWVIQRLKHGFDLLNKSDEEFKKIFIDWVKNEYTLSEYTITYYDYYLVLKRAEKLDFNENEINPSSSKQELLSKFSSISGFRDEPVHAVQEDVRGIRHNKRKKNNEKRTALLGTYVGKGNRKNHVPRTLGAFVEEAPNQEKIDSRKEKWLRVPDEDWSSLVNAEWVNAMASHGHNFKIASPLSEEQMELIRTAFKSAQNGSTFLTALRTKYYDKQVRKSKNPLWDDTREDHEADAPSTLAYEIAGLLDEGKYELDPLYEDRKGMLKIRKRQHGKNEARKQQMEAIYHKDFLAIQEFNQFCITKIESLIERRSNGDLKVYNTVKAVRTQHYSQLRDQWVAAAKVARENNFKIFLKKRKILRASLMAWKKALDIILLTEPNVKSKHKNFFHRLLSDAKKELDSFDTSKWTRFLNS